MPLATGFARSSDVKSEVSRGHSRGDLKGRTLTTRVEVTTLMTNSSGPQNNVLEGRLSRRKAGRTAQCRRTCLIAYFLNYCTDDTARTLRSSYRAPEFCHFDETI